MDDPETPKGLSKAQWIELLESFHRKIMAQPFKPSPRPLLSGKDYAFIRLLRESGAPEEQVEEEMWKRAIGFV